MKCQILFSGENITNLLSAELSKSVVKVNFVLLSAIFCEVECLILFVIFVVVFFFFFLFFCFCEIVQFFLIC